MATYSLLTTTQDRSETSLASGGCRLFSSLGLVAALCCVLGCDPTVVEVGEEIDPVAEREAEVHAKLGVERDMLSAAVETSEKELEDATLDAAEASSARSKERAARRLLEARVAVKSAREALNRFERGLEN